MSKLPPAIQAVADLVADEPQAIQQNFLYVLCLILVEEGEMVETAPDAPGPSLNLAFQGETFTIPRRELDADMEEMLRAEIRSFLKESGGIG